MKNCRLDGRYDITSQLGRGSYAEIYIAEDTVASPHSAHKTVVIKALNVFLQNDLDRDLEQTLVENFQNEAISLDRVRHPNVISRLGHGTARDLNGTLFHYLVLEYLPGGDMSQFRRDRDLTVTEVLGYLEQVCAGLSNAHKHSIIHRDIKPQNLLLTADYKFVKIADFGVARSTISDNPITRVGTNIYAPPEHSPLLADNGPSTPSSVLTPAADIYSLAKTAYSLFTGETPRYLSNNPIDELPHSFRDQPCAANLLAVLRKATDSDPAKRHQTVDEFWLDLSRINEIVSAELPLGEHTEITKVRSRPAQAPEPHVALGFSPNKPVSPRFDTTKELKLNTVAPTTRLDANTTAARIPIANGAPPVVREPTPIQTPNEVPNETQGEIPDFELVEEVERKSGWGRVFKGAAALLILLVIFAGSLFATYNYLLGRPLFSFETEPAHRLGIASTDINLRPGPTTSNTPLGIVTRNSVVRILRTSNNWHEVVIIRQGRIRSDAGNAVRGWVYGRYINEEN